MSNKNTLWPLAVFAALCFFSRPGAADTLQLGIYAPRLPFPDNERRVAWAQRVGQLLEAQSGLSIQARAFTKSSDLLAFVDAGRIQLVLADPVFLVEFPHRFSALASGTGPEGPSPPYAVLVPSGYMGEGINPLKKERLALVDVGRLEVALLSNLSFEGLINVVDWFGDIDWVTDLSEATNRVTTKKVRATLGYASVGRKSGLRISVRLRGIPLPMLAIVRNHIDDDVVTVMNSAVDGTGLSLPPAGPLSRLIPADPALLPRVQAATARPPGKPQPRRPVWSPSALQSLDRNYPVTRRRKVPLEPPLRRWRRPKFPKTGPGRGLVSK